MNAREYYESLIHGLTAVPFVLRVNLTFNETDRDECFIEGRVHFLHGYELHVAEYIVTAPNFLRPKYRYHLQTSQGKLIRRWDNAPHHRSLPGFPNHCHHEDGSVHSTPAMELNLVMREITLLLFS